MRIKSFPVVVYDMALCSFSINFCALSSSCCCIIVANSPSLMIIFSFFSRFWTSSSSSHFRVKASWASLHIAVLSFGGLDMSIAEYNYWGELIYHFFWTDLLRSIFAPFSAVSFKNLSSLCCNIAARILSVSVAGQLILRYRAMSVTS